MASQNQFKFLLPIIFVLSVFLFAPSPSVIAEPAKPQALCKGDVPDKQFCLKILADPKAKAATDNVELTDAVMKLAATKAKKTLDAINAMSKQQKSPEAIKGLKTCEEIYQNAVKSFDMIPEEVEEDAESANYDVSLIGPEVDRCSEALKSAKIDPKAIDTANKNVEDYSRLGAEITDKVEN